MDFEKAVLNAFQKNFTDATLSGCYFHLCQSFVRKIKEVGLKSVYEQNPGLALSLRRIAALAFLPLEEAEPAFDLVVEEITGEVELLSLEEDVLEKIDLLASYFQITYLSHNIGSTHRPAPPSPTVFQPVIWNQSVSAIDGLAPTNNATEGWHFGLQALFQGSHPNIWIFLPQLKKDSLVHKFNAIQGLAGAENPTLKKYRLLNNRVQNICRAYEAGEKNSLLESYRSFAVKKGFMRGMKTFLFAIWFPNSSSSFPFLIQHFFFSWCFHWVTINGRPVASSPGCQSCALPLITALLCSHIRTTPMKLQSVTEEQTNLWKE